MMPIYDSLIPGKTYLTPNALKGTHAFVQSDVNEVMNSKSKLDTKLIKPGTPFMFINKVVTKEKERYEHVFLSVLMDRIYIIEFYVPSLYATFDFPPL